MGCCSPPLFLTAGFCWYPSYLVILVCFDRVVWCVEWRFVSCVRLSWRLEYVWYIRVDAVVLLCSFQIWHYILPMFLEVWDVALVFKALPFASVVRFAAWLAFLELALVFWCLMGYVIVESGCHGLFSKAFGADAAIRMG